VHCMRRLRKKPQKLVWHCLRIRGPRKLRQF